MTEACCRCTLQDIQSGSTATFPPCSIREPDWLGFSLCIVPILSQHFYVERSSSTTSPGSHFPPPSTFPPRPSTHPGPFLGLQPLHDHHGVHVLVVLFLLVLVALLGLLQPLLELPLQHQLPEAVALLRRSLGLCLEKERRHGLTAVARTLGTRDPFQCRSKENVQVQHRFRKPQSSDKVYGGRSLGVRAKQTAKCLGTVPLVSFN